MNNKNNFSLLDLLLMYKCWKKISKIRYEEHLCGHSQVLFQLNLDFVLWDSNYRNERKSLLALEKNPKRA